MFTAESRFLLPPALIRMGDLLHQGHKDPFTAAEMYTKAALRNDPQVRYTLVSACVFPHPTICVHVCTCESSRASSGVVQPRPPRGRGLQPAVVSNA